MSYSELESEANTYADGRTQHHYTKCYGNDNDNDKNITSVKFCNSTVDDSCLSQLSPKGDIIKCTQCAKLNNNDSGIWMYRDGKKTWIPDCECPAAVKASGISNSIGSNVCGFPLQVMKPIKRYHSTKKKSK